MNKKTTFTLFVVFGFVLVSCVGKEEKREPVTIQTSASLLAMSLDDLIVDSEIIVIGEITTTFPSYWMRQNEKDAQEATLEEIYEDHGWFFTDSIFAITDVIKGAPEDSAVRVRTFIGKTEQIQVFSSSEPEYLEGHTYLLFLVKDTGPTQIVEPGDYIATGAMQGVYEIVDGKAISIGWTGDWNIDDLVTTIQKTLRGDTRILINFDDPLIGGERVAIEDAPAKVHFSIRQPEGFEIKETWVSPETAGPYGRSVAIQFENDLLLIIQRLIQSPDWDGMIMNFPEFTKITINGNEGMGSSSGIAFIEGLEYPYPGSVGWWAEGLDFSLYSNTLSLEELLKIAETVH